MLLSNAELLEDADYLALANEELQSYITPWLLAFHEEWFVDSATVTLVAGTAAYDIPERAITGSLKDVQFLNGTSYVPLTRLEPQEALDVTSGSSPSGYSLQDTQVVIHPTPAASGTVRFKFFRRPSRLVATTAVGEIDGAVSASTAITLTATKPSTFVADEVVDIIRAKSGFRSIDDDNTLAAAAGSSLTLGSAVTASDGDFVCLAGESPIPQIPVEAHSLLVARVVYRALMAQGDAKAGAAKGQADELAQRLKSALSPRVQDSTRYVINPNGPGNRSKWRRRNTSS